MLGHIATAGLLRAPDTLDLPEETLALLEARCIVLAQVRFLVVVVHDGLQCGLHGPHTHIRCACFNVESKSGIIPAVSYLLKEDVLFLKMFDERHQGFLLHLGCPGHGLDNLLFPVMFKEPSFEVVNEHVPGKFVEVVIIGIVPVFDVQVLEATGGGEELVTIVDHLHLEVLLAGSSLVEDNGRSDLSCHEDRYMFRRGVYKLCHV